MDNLPICEAEFRHSAPGGPGIEPRWTRGAKNGIGTAYSTDSRVWFTLAQGTLTEIYYPRVDRPQIRDLQYLVSDDSTFFVGERRDCVSDGGLLSDDGLGFRVETRDRAGRFTLHKEFISDPHLNCVLIRTRFEAEAGLHLYALCAPHLGGGGRHNSAVVDTGLGRPLLLACRDGIWMALGADLPFARVSCGYAGVNDGWTQLSRNHRLTEEYDCALDGNVALTGELDLSDGNTFTLGLAFGGTRNAAVNTLLQSLREPFAQKRERFLEQWHRVAAHKRNLHPQSGDGGKLLDRSYSILLAHEDKVYPGAMIASLSIPWGEAKGDDDLGGYHLVWTRDLMQSATGLLAAGDEATALRALVYLAASQRADGGFAQNFWVDGRPYWQGLQLDEVAIPILLAWQMQRHRRLRGFDPVPMVRRAAGFLMRQGPATGQERWEECGGYSPSTLAAVIAGLVCAAKLLQSREGDAAALCLEYADFLEAHLEPWTVTNQGALLAGVPRHYVRINPAPLAGDGANEDLETARVRINNLPPWVPNEFPARDIVDAGFLQLVRFGVRAADDPIVVDSLKVVDACLKRETPSGPAWLRYNHDGYGQRPDGGAFFGWGQGRPWPLLTGERGMYELAAGHDARPYLHALERFASRYGPLPEQVWDAPDLPADFLRCGRATGSAMPLAWAHAEYLKLLASIADKRPFGLIPAVAARYQLGRRRHNKTLEIWKFNRRLTAVPPGTRLRIQAEAAFLLHYSLDEWQTTHDLVSTPTVFGFNYADVEIAASQRAPLRFTFRWEPQGRWEGRDYEVGVT